MRHFTRYWKITRRWVVLKLEAMRRGHSQNTTTRVSGGYEQRSQPKHRNMWERNQSQKFQSNQRDIKSCVLQGFSRGVIYCRVQVRRRRCIRTSEPATTSMRSQTIAIADSSVGNRRRALELAPASQSIVNREDQRISKAMRVILCNLITY